MEEGIVLIAVAAQFADAGNDGAVAACVAAVLFSLMARVVEELAIVQPRIVVVMGPEALAVLNDLDVPLSRPVAPEAGVVQQLTPSIDALYVPSIDESLDEEVAKREFWSAFRMLGAWYADLPPY